MTSSYFLYVQPFFSTQDNYAPWPAMLTDTHGALSGLDCLDQVLVGDKKKKLHCKSKNGHIKTYFDWKVQEIIIKTLTEGFCSEKHLPLWSTQGYLTGYLTHVYYQYHGWNSATKLTASILKPDQNSHKIKKNAYFTFTLIKGKPFKCTTERLDQFDTGLRKWVVLLSAHRHKYKDQQCNRPAAVGQLCTSELRLIQTNPESQAQLTS